MTIDNIIHRYTPPLLLIPDNYSSTKRASLPDMHIVLHTYINNINIHKAKPKILNPLL